MDTKEQIALWVQGRSLHNDNPSCCVPDFSCCDPTLLAPVEVRQAYLKAYQENNVQLIHDIQIQFLQAACNGIAARDPEIGSINVADNTRYNHKVS